RRSGPGPGRGRGPPAGELHHRERWSWSSYRHLLLLPVRRRRFLAPHLRRGVLDRPDDVVVAGATAQVAFDGVADLVLGGWLLLLEEPDRRHDHPRRAVATLEPVTLPGALLDGVERTVVGEALDGGDGSPVGLDGEHRAGLDRLAVGHH